MGIIYNIWLSILEPMAAVASPGKGIHHSCGVETSSCGATAIPEEIVADVLIAIGIAGFVIVTCFIVKAIAGYKEQKLRLDSEERRSAAERVMQQYRNRLDSAWRCLNSLDKKKGVELTQEESNLVKSARDYLARTFTESQIPEAGNKK